MAEIEETLLPGVGVRHEFTTTAGDRLVVLTYRGGRRELALRNPRDPDACSTILQLSPEDSGTLVELLGGSHISETVSAVQQQVEGLAIEWVTVAGESPPAGASIADRDLRRRSGASIVAVVRGDTTIPAPGPDFVLTGGDVVVAIGTPEGLEQLNTLLAD